MAAVSSRWLQLDVGAPAFSDLTAKAPKNATSRQKAADDPWSISYLGGEVLRSLASWRLSLGPSSVRQREEQRFNRQDAEER
mgnify:FL=1